MLQEAEEVHRESEEAKVDRGGLSSVCLLCSTVQVSMDGWKLPKVVRDECAQMLPWPSREEAEYTAALACTIAARFTVPLVPRLSAKGSDGQHD